MYLQSIEDEDSSFAAPVYVRGFIRTYARFLGLDAEAAVTHFRVSLGEHALKAHEPAAFARRTRSGTSPWLWVAGLAAALLVTFVGFKFFEFQRSGTTSAATVVGIASPGPVTATAAPVATQKPSVKAVTQTLEVRVTQDSWVSVKIDGASRLVGIVKAGTTKAFHGKNADVRAGNAGGVDLSVNGKELGKMGDTGAVVERTLTLAEQ
ncbi:MAG: DUF4115 domain-containing protein [Vulcanimicrobiaceae bacterium]